MGITLAELVVAALAVWQIVEIWHHSSLLAPLRAKAELLDGKVGELLRCPFCLSVWVALLVGLIVLLPAEWWAWPFKAAVIAFALSRAANLGNDLTREWCRTPQINKLDHTGDGDDDTTPPAAKQTGPLKIHLTLTDQRDSKATFEKKADDGKQPSSDATGDATTPVRPGGV